MATMNRRGFLQAAALACPFLAAAGLGPAWAQQKKDPTGYAVLKAKCDGCGDCIEVCPVEAIAIKDDVAVIDDDACIECGECVDECPTEAIVEKKSLPKDAAAKPPATKDAATAAVSVVGAWVMIGTFTDGTSSSPETIRFDGTPASGALIAAQTGESQGSYRVEGRDVELRLPGGLTVKGRILSADLMEGTLPDGRWRAERKRTGLHPA
jgi:ferredoxin